MSAPLIYLLPALGTDERLFALQTIEFPQIRVIRWPSPRFGESLSDYAGRIAATIPAGEPCYVGGVSLGAMVAQEIAQRVPALGCFVISSLRSPAELPRIARTLAPWAWLLPPRADLLVAALGYTVRYTVSPVLPRTWRQFFVHLSKLRSPALPWACRAVPKWKPPPKRWSCPIHQLHGDRDPIFPHTLTTPDHLVRGGGHLLTLTHPFEVNAYLRRVLTGQHSAIPSPSGNGTGNSPSNPTAAKPAENQPEGR